MLKKTSIILFISTFQFACTSYQPPPSVYDPYYQSRQTYPQGRYGGRQHAPVTESKPAYKMAPSIQSHSEISEPSSPAVIALMTEAEKSKRAGNLDSAVATLERAWRIQPRNANLVYKLAELRLKQGKPRLSEDLAKKANLLAAGNHILKKRSWLLIAEARRQQGKHSAALEAENNARQYDFH